MALSRGGENLFRFGIHVASEGKHDVRQPQGEAIDNQGIGVAGSNGFRNFERLFDGGEFGATLGAMFGDTSLHFEIMRLGGRKKGQPRSTLAGQVERIAALATARAAADQNHSHKLLRRDRKIQMKNGPPASAVRTPTGISVGAITVREMVSQTARNAPPASMEHGIRTR